MTLRKKGKSVSGYKHNGYMYVFMTIIASIMILSLGLMSCRPDSDLGEYTVPDTYTTYTDKNGLFSISYPSDWIIDPQNLSAFEAESDSFNEYLNEDSPYIWPEEITSQPKYRWTLFYVDNDEESATKGRVRLIPFSISRRFPIKMTKEQIYSGVTESKDYRPFLQETLRIAGREVAIFKWDYSDRIALGSAVIIGDIVWVIACDGDSQYEKDYQIMVRSLRVLK